MLKQASGAIVNVASTAGLNPLANRAAYCANKAGVIGLTRQMALQYSRKGVRVNAVCPGSTKTPFFKEAMAKLSDPEAVEAASRARLPIGRLGEPEEIANSIAYLASEEASLITGAILDLDGGNTLRSTAFSTYISFRHDGGSTSIGGAELDGSFALCDSRGYGDKAQANAVSVTGRIKALAANASGSGIMNCGT